MTLTEYEATLTCLSNLKELQSCIGETRDHRYFLNDLPKPVVKLGLPILRELNPDEENDDFNLLSLPIKEADRSKLEELAGRYQVIPLPVFDIDGSPVTDKRAMATTLMNTLDIVCFQLRHIYINNKTEKYDCFTGYIEQIGVRGAVPTTPTTPSPRKDLSKLYKPAKNGGSSKASIFSTNKASNAEPSIKAPTGTNQPSPLRNPAIEQPAAVPAPRLAPGAASKFTRPATRAASSKASENAVKPVTAAIDVNDAANSCISSAGSEGTLSSGSAASANDDKKGKRKESEDTVVVIIPDAKRQKP